MFVLFLSFLKNIIFVCAGSLLLCVGFSLQWLLLLQSTDSRAHGLQHLQLLGSVLVAPGLLGSVVVMHELSCSWHVGSSPIRDGTLVSCIGRQILYHRATREAPKSTFLDDQPGILKQ